MDADGVRAEDLRPRAVGDVRASRYFHASRPFMTCASASAMFAPRVSGSFIRSLLREPGGGVDDARSAPERLARLQDRLTLHRPRAVRENVRGRGSVPS